MPWNMEYRLNRYTEYIRHEMPATAVKLEPSFPDARIPNNSQERGPAHHPEEELGVISLSTELDRYVLKELCSFDI